MAEHRRFEGLHPAAIAIVLAFVCAVIVTLLIHDRWSRPVALARGFRRRPAQ